MTLPPPYFTNEVVCFGAWAGPSFPHSSGASLYFFIFFFGKF
uniref:Uncharacterized protein n=1 Tax=Anguilla anguilla TaxID=7936 RepID=A0A0E9WFY9_ANGAN